MQTPIVYGADVAKLRLVIARLDAAHVELGNDETSIRQWLAGVAAGSLLGVESTGPLHRLLARLAYEHGLIVYVLNPRDIHYYARALGSRGKTDRSDAAVVARYVAAEHARLRPYQPATALQERIDELLRKRARIVRHRDGLRRTLADLPALQSAAKQVMQTLASLLERIDEQLAQAVRADGKTEQRAALLRSIPGIGPLTSVCLANLFERVQLSGADALVAFAGLDPRPNDSGEHRGRRKLTKRGPAELRRLLYCAALTAARSLFRPLYNALRARGLASTQANCILARKLLRIAWAVSRTGSPFNPALINKPG